MSVIIGIMKTKPQLATRSYMFHSRVTSEYFVSNLYNHIHFVCNLN